MPKKYKTAEEALAAYEELCGDARELLAGDPNPEYPEYKGKSISEVHELFEKWQIEEAYKIVQRQNELVDALDFDTVEESDKYYSSIRECEALDKIRRMVGE